MRASIRVVMYPGEDGYIVAECLDIPGCVSQGKPEEQAYENIQDAINECLEVMFEDLLKDLAETRPTPKESKPRSFRVTPPTLANAPV